MTNFLFIYACDTSIQTQQDVPFKFGGWCLDNLGDVIIPIVIFALGYFITILIEKRKKKKELSCYKKMVMEWLKSIKKGIEAYINYLDVFAKAIESNDGLNIAQYATTNISIEGLRQLSVERMMDVLIINHKLEKTEHQNAIKKMYTIISCLEYIEKNNSHIWNTYQEYIKSVNQCRFDWNENMKQLHRLVRRKETNDRFSEAELTFLRKINKIYDEVFEMQGGQQQDIAIPFWKENFINKIIAEYLELEILLKDSEYAEKIMHTINNLIFTYNQIQANKLYASVFQKMKDGMNTAYTSIYEAVDFFEDKSLKNFWNIR